MRPVWQLRLSIPSVWFQDWDKLVGFILDQAKQIAETRNTRKKGVKSLHHPIVFGKLTTIWRLVATGAEARGSARSRGVEHIHRQV
jgi:hypothetical protein